MAFLSPPGREKLYSGVQKITPSAARIASARVFTAAGKPVVFLNVGVIERELRKRRCFLDGHPDRCEPRQEVHDHAIV
jgi:hypothetical protein